MAAEQVTIVVNGKSVVATRDGDRHLLVQLAGRTVRVPVGIKGTITVPSAVPAPQPVEVDESSVLAAKLAKVRRHAQMAPIPKSARESYRIARERAAVREAHSQGFRNGLAQGRSELMRAPLAERLSEVESSDLVTLMLEHVVSDAELRAGLRMVCALADGDDVRTTDAVAPPAPVEPAPVEDDVLTDDYSEDVTASTVAAVRSERSIGDLIDEISAQVGEPAVFATEPAAAVEAHPMVPEPVFVAPAPSQAVVSAPSKPAQPRALWLGTMSAGMMSVPVRLHTMHTDDHGLSTFSSHDADGGRIKYVKTCAECGEIVDPADIGRGHKGHDGTVNITAAELKGLDVESLKSISISEFVPAADVDVALFEAHYQVAPGKGGAKAYALFRESLRVEGKVAIARIVMRSTERVVAIRVVEDSLVASVLRWDDQIKPRVDIEAAEFTDVEMDQARALVQAMGAKFVHSQHVDHAQTALVELFNSKAA